MAEPASTRYSRNVGLFGLKGQQRLERERVAVVGLGGLGCHVVQQLAYLGVQRFVLVDPDAIDLSNLNRLVGATLEDVGSKKAPIAERVIRQIAPNASIVCFQEPLGTASVDDAVSDSNWLFGCVDNDAARLVLTDLASRNRIAYIDLASDVGHDESTTWFGGRVFVTEGGNQCLSCAMELDQQELAIASMSPEQRKVDERLYGVDRSLLDGSGPMVVSINGTVASLGVTEFVCAVTELRAPKPHLVYRGDLGIVTVRAEKRTSSCYYCDVLWRDRS